MSEAYSVLTDQRYLTLQLSIFFTSIFLIGTWHMSDWIPNRKDEKGYLLYYADQTHVTE